MKTAVWVLLTGAWASLGAQTYRVVPAAAASTDAGAGSHLPFGFGAVRMQQVVDGAAVCKTSATLTHVAMRRNTGTLAKYLKRASPGRIVPLTVRAAMTRANLRAMSRTFADNTAFGTTTVFSGAYNLPTLPPPRQATAPWAPVVPFQRPYLYARRAGNLLLEFVLRGTAGPYLYGLDADGAVGSATPFGGHGPFRRRFTGSLTVDRTLLVAGGCIEATARIPANVPPPPALLLLGHSRDWYGPLRLPVDLGPVGAGGNALYTSVDLVLPMQLTMHKVLGIRGGTSIPLPANPLFRGSRLFAQALYLDPPSNALGFVLSNGVDLRIASDAMPSTRCIFALDPDAVRGEYGFLNYPGLGGPVLRFTGRFQ